MGIIASESADAACGTCWLRYDRVLHPFRDSLIPSGTIVHSNPLNLQLTMQATLIWNDKRTPVIPLTESGSIHSIWSDFYPSIMCLCILSLTTQTCIITKIYTLCISPRSFSPSVRMCRGKAQLCRMNVNV